MAGTAESVLDRTAEQEQASVNGVVKLSFQELAGDGIVIGPSRFAANGLGEAIAANASAVAERANFLAEATGIGRRPRVNANSDIAVGDNQLTSGGISFGDGLGMAVAGRQT